MSSPRLVVDTSRGDSREVALNDEVTIGRGPANTVPIDENAVSRKHAIIAVDGDGVFVLRDLGSANGTFLNDRRLIAPTRLSGGDIVRIGSTSITFVDTSGRSHSPADEAGGQTTSLKASDTARVMIGRSAAMTEVFSLIEKASASKIPVLVEGETGTGKELVARALHEASPLSRAPFLAVNCAAVSESLLESELFGHKRGAFTGATEDRRGLFEVASAGTVFLDEIGEMPIGMQAKLLRVLQEGEVTRVGESQPRKVDFRLVSATNRDLLAEADSDRFRRDLYYRIAAFPIRIPPLRERREDIADVTTMLLAAAMRRQGKRTGALSPDAMAALKRFDWPGNVRELQNEIERAVTMVGAGEPIEVSHLSAKLTGAGPSPAEAASSAADSGELRARTAAFERTEVEAALERQGGNKTRAAKELGITYQGLLKKMKRLGMVD